MATQVDANGNPVRTPSGNLITVAAGNAVQGASSVVSGTANAIVGTAGSAITGIAAGAIGQAAAPIIDVAQKVNTVVDLVKNPTLGGVLALAGQGIPPYRNELNQFSSYSYKITLGCLTNLELNFPLTYKALGPAVKILRSGGTGGNKIPTLYETDGKVEFFIEDLEIETICSPNERTRMSNARAINFKIIEPYSMGQFLHNLRTAALVCGHANYLSAPFVLSIEFIGYDDDGNVVEPSFSSRHIPFKFRNAEMKVTESGAVYTCDAFPYNHIAMNDSTQDVMADIQIKGQTVAEALQTGAESLTAKLNARQIDLEDANQIPAADYYIVSFPQNGLVQQAGGSVLASLGATVGSAGGRQDLYESIVGNNAGDIPADLDAKLQELPGVQVLGSALAEQLRTLAETSINNIGSARILPRGRPPGMGSPMQEAGFVEDEENPGYFRRDGLAYNSETQEFNFPSATRIQDIIEEIVVNSDFGRNMANEDVSDGTVTTHLVVPEVYNASSLFGGLISGRNPRIYVYQVIPYTVDASDVSAPATSAVSSFLRQAQAIKSYEYIYSGQNDDIIDFDINFNAVFKANALSSRGQTGSGTILDAVERLFKGDPQPAPTTNTGATAGQIGTEGAAEAGETPETTSGNNGGGPADDTEVAVARMMNDQIMFSDRDLAFVDLTIHGDPYYVSDVGFANGIGIPNPLNAAITVDGQMNPVNGQVLVALSFRTPIDYDEGDGFVKYPLGGFLPVSFFSGIYQVRLVRNSFKDGVFTQTLNLARKRNQDLTLESIGSSLLSSITGAGRAIGLGGDESEIRDDIDGLNE